MKTQTLRLLIVLFVIVVSCKKGLVEQEASVPQYKKEAVLSEAKRYFYAQEKAGDVVKNYLSTINSEQITPVKLQAIWKEALVVTTKKLTFVEVPVRNKAKKVTLYNFDRQKSDNNTDLARIKAAFQRILIYKEKNGNYSQVLLTYIPDYEYLQRKTEKFSKNHINNISEEFSGYISYSSTTSGKVSSVLRFVKGKLVKKRLPRDKGRNVSTDTSPKSSKESSTTVMTMVEICYPIYIYPGCEEEGGSEGGEDDGEEEEDPCGDQEPIFDGEECYWEDDGQEEPDPNGDCYDPEGAYLCGEEDAAIVTLTNGALICGYYPSTKIGNAYTGGVNNLGFSMTVTKDGVSEHIDVIIGASCFTAKNPPNSALASAAFVTAYNAAILAVEYEVKYNIISNPNSVNLRTALAAQINIALTGTAGFGSTFSTGPCLNGVPSSNAQYCEGGEE